jgi:hypothetical protein
MAETCNFLVEKLYLLEKLINRVSRDLPKLAFKK